MVGARAARRASADIVTISTRVRRHAQVLAIAERFPTVFCSVGTHPHHAHEELDVTADDLVARAQHPKVVAIGEAGLDYHYDNSPRDAQEQGFRTHIAAARETGLPLVIHAREADDDTARILEEEAGKGRLPGRAALLHRRAAISRAAASRSGIIVSFTGILTFKNSARPARHRERRAGGPHPGRDRRAVSRAACRIAASATSRPMWSRPRRLLAEAARRLADEIAARPPRISSGCSQKCRAARPTAA